MFKTLKDFSVENKRILVRCDFNVPLTDKGEILDDLRIKESIVTIKYLIEKNSKVILMSHLDPKSTGVAASGYNLDNVAKRLSEYLGLPVIKKNDCVGPEVENQTKELKVGQVMLLENLRFHKEETENNLDFAKNLSNLGDIYINDAFSVCHRAHASIVGVPQYLPHAAGLLLEKEITTLDKIMQNPQRPMIAIVGGKKVETKSKFIDKISEIADFVIISGLIKKEIEDKKIVFRNQDKIIGPLDNLAGLDIDSDSIKIFKEKILQAKTILWNGPFGKTEDRAYEKGTLAIAEAIIKSKAYSVVGGGETVEFITRKGIIDKFSHVSTGGGAMMSYLAGDKLPGLEALQ